MGRGFTKYLSAGPPGDGGAKTCGKTLNALDVLYPENPRLMTSNRRRTSDTRNWCQPNDCHGKCDIGMGD